MILNFYTFGILGNRLGVSQGQSHNSQTLLQNVLGCCNLQNIIRRRPQIYPELLDREDVNHRRLAEAWGEGTQSSRYE